MLFSQPSQHVAAQFVPESDQLRGVFLPRPGRSRSVRRQRPDAQDFIPAQRFQMRFRQRQHGQCFSDRVEDFDRIARFRSDRRRKVVLNHRRHVTATNPFRREIDGQRHATVEREFHL